MRIEHLEDLFGMLEALEKEEQAMKDRFLEQRKKKMEDEADQEVVCSWIPWSAS